MKYRLADFIVYAPIAVLLLLGTFRVEGDSTVLVIGAENAVRCLQAGEIPCNDNVSHFPLFQYLYVAPTLALGANTAAVTKALPYMSMGFAAFAAAIFWRIGREIAGSAGAHFALALLFSGYAMFYFFSSFNEMAAFALFAAFSAAVLLRSACPTIMLLAFLCSVTKDIAAPFVLAFYLTALAARETPWDWPPIICRSGVSEVPARTIGAE